MKIMNEQEEQDFFQKLQKQGKFKILPCGLAVNFNDNSQYEKLKLSPEQKIQITGLLQHVPMAVAANAMAGAYTVSFPKGLPHTLLALKQGGLGSQIIDNGRIVGSASFYPMLRQAAVFSAFSLMSIVTGQFFLFQITKELHMINKKIDDILKFLYGEKKAELLSEIKFVKYACENYAHIMAHDQQRTATLVSIQEARKVAVKDMEFYMNDLNEKIKFNGKEKFDSLANFIEYKIGQIKENINLSLQLYLISTLMEMYYAENFDEHYMKYLEDDIKNYIENWTNQMHLCYGSLREILKSPVAKKYEPKRKKYAQNNENEITLQQEKSGLLYSQLSEALHKPTQSKEYYLTADGDVYYKKS